MLFQIPLAVVATDLYTQEKLVGSVPYLGHHLVDEGTADPVPVRIAKKYGAQVIIAVIEKWSAFLAWLNKGWRFLSGSFPKKSFVRLIFSLKWTLKTFGFSETITKKSTSGGAVKPVNCFLALRKSWLKID